MVSANGIIWFISIQLIYIDSLTSREIFSAFQILHIPSF